LKPIDVNEIVCGALDALRAELEDHGVLALTELTSELPLVMGHSGQLQEVILNLAHNAIDAMDTNTDGDRALRVLTKNHDLNAITVAAAAWPLAHNSRHLNHLLEGRSRLGAQAVHIF
jgi:C4-dicarboxylate-specific signal transduction histidine kinase